LSLNPPIVMETEVGLRLELSPIRLQRIAQTQNGGG
jgi:hypothetical protein